MKNKKFKLNRLGFTLVELLAVIAILSVVMSIVLYFVIDTVRVARNNSYQVTISNIESEVSSYVSEQNKSSDWIYNNGGKTQHQCVTVQNLIDKGYFKGDILNSYVDDKNKVKATDYVYIERDINTKTITKSIFKPKSFGLCYGYDDPLEEEDQTINFEGNISFSILQEGWQKKKDVVITYQIIKADNISNYKYDYVFYPEGGSSSINFNEKTFLLNTHIVSLNVNKNGIIVAIITDKSGNVMKREKLEITMIDNEPPVITCNKNTNVVKIKQNFKNDQGIFTGEYEYLTLLNDPIDGYAIDSYKDEITNYDKECTFFYYKHNRPAQSTYPEYEDMFLVTDDGELGGSVGELVYKDQDGNETGSRTDANSCIWRATSCNCVYGYCEAIYTYKVYDRAGNYAEKQFVFYHMYENSVSWRQKNCDKNREPLNKDLVCNH